MPSSTSATASTACESRKLLDNPSCLGLTFHSMGSCVSKTVVWSALPLNIGLSPMMRVQAKARTGMSRDEWSNLLACVHIGWQVFFCQFALLFH